MEGLGRLFDVGSVVAPIADLAAGANAGHRIHMKNAAAVTFVAYLGVVSAGTDTTVLDTQEANASTGGTSRDLDVVTNYYYKAEATLDGDETWTKVTQAAASEISLTGATFAAQQMIVVWTVSANSLSDGYEWLTVDIADAGAGGTRPGCVLALLHDLAVKRAPANLAQLNA